MERPEIEIVVDGPNDSVSVEVLAQAAETLRTLLHGTGAQGWVVSALKVGSTHLAAAPPVSKDCHNRDAEEFKRVVEGLIAVTSDEEPKGWDDSALDSLVRLNNRVSEVSALQGARVVTRSDSSTEHTFYLDERFAVKAENMLNKLKHSAQAFGSVTGVVDRFRSRNGNREFGLIDTESGRPVSVHFSKDDEDTVRKLIGIKVVAWGMLRRNPSTNQKKILTMEGIKVINEPNEISENVTVADFEGILGTDWTGGLDSVSWVRAQRD
jgi:hypothetical protein